MTRRRPDYLNLGTNFLDKDVAGDIATLYAAALQHWFHARFAGAEVVLLGMEMAGGVRRGRPAPAACAWRGADVRAHAAGTESRGWRCGGRRVRDRRRWS